MNHELLLGLQLNSIFKTFLNTARAGFLYCLTLVMLLSVRVKVNSIMGVSVYVRTNQQPQIMQQNLNAFLTFRIIHHIRLYF